MSDQLLEQARALLSAARTAFNADPAAVRLIEQAEHRLDEPLRLAIAGMVKAGKSTLLNAIIGEEIAPTDAGECTRVVTWYRFGRTPRIVLHPRVGEPREIPVQRRRGQLQLSLDGLSAEEVDRLEVEWPSDSLHRLTLIDTPGIASLSEEVAQRSRGFLLPADEVSGADAIVYLLRHLHAADLRFLDAFHDRAVGATATVNAIAVLSRADEVGAGRMDAMLSAQEVAARYRAHGTLRSLALDVKPVAGLLAQSARTLREWEFHALSELAGVDRGQREELLVSADRFTLPHPAITSTPRERGELLDRLGIFGIRVAASLLRGSAASSSSALAEQLRTQSGLDALVAAISTLFVTRGELLRLRSVLETVRQLRRSAPSDAAIGALVERIELQTHGLRELQLLADLRTSGLAARNRRPPVVAPAAPGAAEGGAGSRAAEQPTGGWSGFTSEEVAGIERLLGLAGDGLAQRLGAPPEASGEQLQRLAGDLVMRWRARLADPKLDPQARRAVDTVIRSAEAQLVRAQQLSGGRIRRGTRLTLGAEPVSGVGQ